MRESVGISDESDDDGDKTNDDDDLMQAKWCAQELSLKRTQDWQPENTPELSKSQGFQPNLKTLKFKTW